MLNGTRFAVVLALFSSWSTPPATAQSTGAESACKQLLQDITAARATVGGSGVTSEWRLLTDLRERALLACDEERVDHLLAARALIEARWLPSADAPARQLALAQRTIELLEASEWARTPEMIAALEWRAWIPGQDTNGDLQRALELRTSLSGEGSPQWAEGFASWTTFRHESARKASDAAGASAVERDLENAIENLDAGIAGERGAKVVLLQALHGLYTREGRLQAAEALLDRILDLDPEFHTARAR